MNIPQKDIELHMFNEGVDSDTAPELFSPNRATYMLNVRTETLGEKGVVTNIKGNTLISTPLPNGINKSIGWGVDEESNKFYFFVANSNHFDTIFQYDGLQNKIIIVLQNITDTNGIDITRFDSDFLINHVDIVQNNLIYWVDALNKARKFNISKAIDKSISGYGNIILEDYINAYKKAPIYSPTAIYYTDLTRKSNYWYGKLPQFISRNIYDDGEKSCWSDYSSVILPPNQSFLGGDQISYENNAIQITIDTGNLIVRKVEIAVKIGSLNFQSVVVLNKDDLEIPDNSQYVYTFYNDIPLTATDQEKVIKPFSTLPLIPKTQAFTKNSMVYTGGIEGWPVVIIDGSVDVSYEQLYLPSGSDNELNHPAFGVLNEFHIDSANYWHTMGNFTVGVDVKKGNIFTLIGKSNTNPQRYYFTYTATAVDTASTVANVFKSFLRSTGRGIPDPHNGISGESIDGSGNALFSHFILGGYKEGPTIWSTSVTPITFDSLKDNGLSINVIKSGSTRQYAILYIDDDGITSLGYTNYKLQARSQSINERQSSFLERPVHIVNVNHKPPVRARYWQLLRTADPLDYIQMLIQQVIEVTTVDSVNYLDLVVGSLFTYQKLHENTVLVYDFQKGDRVTFIRKTSDESLYPPFETEILSYKINTIEQRNATVTIDGTDSVLVADGTIASYVGKSIVINGFERFVIAVIDGSHYRVDTPIAATTATPYSSYSFIDRRGILRIRKPDVTIVPTVEANTLVQLSKPILNISDEYQQFFAFGKKFEIGNYGTDERFHYGSEQNQTDIQPAKVKVIEGDAYWRNRELPTNNSIPGTQVKIEPIEDPNFSDFYESNLHSLGRVYPKDDGSGEKEFDERARFSNNYIEDTHINGLNDFDNLDRNDYNDAYGAIKLSRFRENKLYLFKTLKTGWALVGQTIIQDNSGTELVGTASKLLSQMQYYSWEGGIGNNPESWTSNGNYQYIASTNSGVFLRLAGDGCDPISSIYSYDAKCRGLLSAVSKYNLNIFGGFDRLNGQVLWYIPEYTAYEYNGGFRFSDWDLFGTSLPDGTTYQILGQPLNSIVTQNDNNNLTLSVGNVLGSDSFSYQATLPGGAIVGPRNKCFNVIANDPNRPRKWVIDNTSFYCDLISGANTGNQGWSKLKEVFIDDNSITGEIKPNIQLINGASVVPNTNTITFNQTDIAPTGGTDGDIWYNKPSDQLYKKISGAWVLQGERVINTDYIQPILNLTSCPIGIACGAESSYSGGESFPTEVDIILGDDLGTVSLHADPFSIPDKFIVEYPKGSGIIVINTGYIGDSSYQSALDAALASRGLPPETIAGPGPIDTSFVKSGTDAVATVRVYAPLDGTSWNFILSCPV